jgi:uncharacterized membrane protein YqjE
MEPEGQPEGFFAPFRRMAQTIVSIGQTRLELFALELQGEKLRFMDTLLRLSVALAFGFVGLFLGALTLALFVWEFARYSGLVAMTAIFLLAAAFLLWRVRGELQKTPPPFSKTLDEFKKDTECFNRPN